MNKDPEKTKNHPGSINKKLVICLAAIAVIVLLACLPIWGCHEDHLKTVKEIVLMFEAEEHCHNVNDLFSEAEERKNAELLQNLGFHNEG